MVEGNNLNAVFRNRGCYSLLITAFICFFTQVNSHLPVLPNVFMTESKAAGKYTGDILAAVAANNIFLARGGVAAC